MKRTVSLVLAAALVLGSIPAGFAASAGETLKGYGVVAGDTNGSLNEDKTITRAEMMTVLARLLGKYEEASKYSIPSTSKDVAGHWNAKVIAFAEKEGWTAGKGNGMFDPQGVVTLQETAAFMLKALGYTITDYAKVVEEATAKGLLKDVVAKELNAPVKRSDVFATALNTLNTPAKDATVKLGEKLGYFKSEALAVGEIKANAANSFQVKFNKAVDPTKVAFAVKRENSAATVTTTWNTEKTLATLTYASKLPEGNYEVTVNDTTTADKPVVMATQKVVIEKEKIAKVEVASETLLRYSETKGYVPYKILNQYGEDVTNTTLGRSINEVETLGAGGDVELKRDAGIAIFTYSSGTTKLRNLPSVVFTIQDTTAGFVFTKTLKVSETANAIAEVKINGIVNEKGEKVDFVWSRTKAYYLDVTVLDTNGQEIKAYDVLKEVDTVPVLQVRASDSTNISLDANGYVAIGDAPGKTNVAAWRITIKSATSPDYDTPVTFSAIAPFGTTGKNNATFTTTLKRAAKVEKFTMLAPAEIATPNRDVEFFFEAFDQNGGKVTSYDDLNGRIQFAANGANVRFVRQADGSAKLFGTFPTKQLYYVTATVTGSLTGSFSQVGVDVKEASNDARVQSLAHTRLYTQGAVWTVGSDKFIIKDKYDRAVNLKTDNEALNYFVRVTTSDSSIVSVNSGTTADVYGGGEVKFTGGGTPGTAVIKYELFNNSTSLSTASAVVYNIDTKDVKSIVLAPSADPTYMTSKDMTGKFYNSTTKSNTDLGNEQVRDLAIVGKTKDGADVRLNGALVTYKSTNQSFAALAKFKANGEFAPTATTATTVASAQYNNGLDVLTATATVNASAEKPVATTVTVDSKAAARRSGMITFVNNVLTVDAGVFNAQFVGKSIYSYDATNGASISNQAPVFFNAESQYGDYVIDKVDVIANKGNGTVKVTNGVIGGTAVTGEEYTITASTENGKKAVISVIISGTAQAAKDPLVVAAENVLVTYEGLPLTTTAEIGTAIAAKVTNDSKAGGSAAALIEALPTSADKTVLAKRLADRNAVIGDFQTTVAKFVAYANASTNPAPTLADYTKLKLAAVSERLAAYNAAVDSAVGTGVDTVNKIATLVNTTNNLYDPLANAAETAVAAYELAVTDLSTPAKIDAALTAKAATAAPIAAGGLDATKKAAFEARVAAANATLKPITDTISLIGAMTGGNGTILATAHLDTLKVTYTAANIAQYRASIGAAANAAAVDTVGKIQAILTAADATFAADTTAVTNAKAALTNGSITFGAAAAAANGATPKILDIADAAGVTYTYSVGTFAGNANGGNAVINVADVDVTRDTAAQFTFVLTVTVQKGIVTATQTYTVTVPTGTGNVTVAKN